MRPAIAAFILALAGCGPGSSPPQPPPRFCVTVRNLGAQPLHAGVGISTDGYASLNTARTIPPHGSETWTFASATPDRVWVHDPRTYDQILAPPVDYADHATSVTVDHP